MSADGLRPPATRIGAPIVALMWAGRLGAALLVVLSLLDGLETFDDENALAEVGRPLTAFADRFRLVNTYHLFGSITRERIEPELQTLDGPLPDEEDDDQAGGGAWTPRELLHKAGDVHRAPDFVAPHQPRLDFQLWFYGLSFRRRQPDTSRRCSKECARIPAAVQPLFAPLCPPTPGAVRLVFWRYQFATPAEKHARAPGQAATGLPRPARSPAPAPPDDRRRPAGEPAGPTLRRASLGTLFLTIFLDLLGFGLVIPFLPGWRAASAPANWWPPCPAPFFG